MFWAFILVAALAAVLIKLGMLSVWVSVLSVGLQAAAVAIGVLIIANVYHRVFAKKSN